MSCKSFEKMCGTVFFLLEPGEHKCIAVKMFDFRGNEVVRGVHWRTQMLVDNPIINSPLKNLCAAGLTRKASQCSGKAVGQLFITSRPERSGLALLPATRLRESRPAGMCQYKSRTKRNTHKIMGPWV